MFGTNPAKLTYKCLPDSLASRQATVILGIKLSHLIHLLMVYQRLSVEGIPVNTSVHSSIFKAFYNMEEC